MVEALSSISVCIDKKFVLKSCLGTFSLLGTNELLGTFIFHEKSYLGTSGTFGDNLSPNVPVVPKYDFVPKRAFVPKCDYPKKKYLKCVIKVFRKVLIFSLNNELYLHCLAQFGAELLEALVRW